jgi:PAS domain S-box-containing protein
LVAERGRQIRAGVGPCRPALTGIQVTRFFGLRAALTLLVLIAIAPVFVVVLQASLAEQRGRLLRAESSLRSLVERDAAHQEQLVEGARHVLTAMAHAPPVFQEDLAACAAYMRNLQADYPAGHGTFGMLDPQGRLTCRATAPAVAVSSADRRFFRDAVATGRFVVGDFTISRASALAVLPLGLPVSDQAGRLRGVVYVALDLARAGEHLRKLTMAPEITLTVADSSAVVLAAVGPGALQPGARMPEGILRQAIASGQPRHGRATDASGEEWIVAVEPVGRPGNGRLFVTGSASTAAVLAPVADRLQLQLGALGLITLLGAVSAWAFGDRIVARPIASLLRRVDALAREEPAPRNLPPPQRGLSELVELDRRFSEMSQRLAERSVQRDVALRAIADSERHYRTLFEANPHPMWVFDQHTLRFLTVNDAAIAHYGYSRDEFLSMTIADIRPPQDVQPLVQELESLSALSTPSQWRHRLKDGRLIDVEISSHVMDFGGRPARLVLALDITRRLRAEEALRQLNETLERRVSERTSELRLANRELESFSYSVSHDLRAPLQVIDGFGRALLARHDEALDGQARHYLDRIRDNTRQMGELIDALLSLARVTRAELRSERIDLSALAREAAGRMRQREPQRQVAVEIEPGLTCDGDARLLAALLDNLIGNAWKFTARTPDARIRVGRKDGPAREPVFYVEDNGAGFEMAYADRLFKAFQRLHTAREFEGTGIGLATVHRIVARHGGRVWAQASPGQGATFHFTLKPATVGEDHPPARQDETGVTRR